MGRLLEQAGGYDVVSYITNFSSGLTSAQLIRSNAPQAKKEIKKLLSGTSRLKATLLVQEKESEEVSKLLLTIREKILGMDWWTMFDSGSLPNTI